MRTTVRSVAGCPGLGDFWVKLSMMPDLAQIGSETSPSMVGASPVEMRVAWNSGRTMVGTGAVSDCANAGAASRPKAHMAAAALADVAIPPPGNAMPP